MQVTAGTSLRNFKDCLATPTSLQIAFSAISTARHAFIARTETLATLFFVFSLVVPDSFLDVTK
jgi:hypothetical protein